MPRKTGLAALGEGRRFSSIRTVLLRNQRFGIEGARAALCAIREPGPRIQGVFRGEEQPQTWPGSDRAAEPRSRGARHEAGRGVSRTNLNLRIIAGG